MTAAYTDLSWVCFASVALKLLLHLLLDNCCVATLQCTQAYEELRAGEASIDTP